MNREVDITTIPTEELLTDAKDAGRENLAMYHLIVSGIDKSGSGYDLNHMLEINCKVAIKICNELLRRLENKNVPLHSYGPCEFIRGSRTDTRTI